MSNTSPPQPEQGGEKAEDILDKYVRYYFEDVRPEHKIQSDALYEAILKAMEEYSRSKPVVVQEEEEIKDFIVKKLGWTIDGTAEANDMVRVSEFVIRRIKELNQ